MYSTFIALYLFTVNVRIDVKAFFFPFIVMQIAFRRTIHFFPHSHVMYLYVYIIQQCVRQR